MLGGVIVVGVLGVFLQGVFLQGVLGADAKVADKGHATFDSSSLGLAFSRVLEAGLDVYTPVSPVLGNTRCRTHGLLLRQGVKEGQLWALHMLDASSKLPSGLLTGNLIQPGNIDQCLAVSHVDPEHGPITGQHCHVHLGAKNAMNAISLDEKILAGSFNATGLEEIESLLSRGRFGDALAHVGATWSLCVPASCTPDDLQRHLQASLPGRIQVRVDPRSCINKQIQENNPWSTIAVLEVFVLCCIGTLIAVGTAYDLLHDGSTSRNQYLLAFSLYTNGKSLLKTTSNTDNLPSFNGLRCISLLWAILVHHFISYVHIPSDNYRSLEEITRSWRHLITANGSMCVDTMFVMSGALLAFLFLRDRERNVKFSVWLFYLYRYIRLTPLLLVMLLLKVAPLFPLKDTPALKIEGDIYVESCVKYGWLGPLYLQNYFDPDYKCMVHVWSSCVDMHLFWLSPLLLFPLWRSPRLGGALLLSLGVASTGAVFSQAYQMQLHPMNLLTSFVMSPEHQTIYFKTHLRATPWLIGVALGYFLHKTKARKDVLSDVQAALGWSASLLLTSYAFLTAHAYFRPGAQSYSVNTALYMALMRPTWALGVAWVLFACERGRGGALNVFLAWPGWQVLARLCYAMTFTNLTLAAGLSYYKKTPQHYNDLQAVIEYFGLLVCSISLAVILHLMVEAPFSRLFQVHISRKLSQQKKDS